MNDKEPKMKFHPKKDDTVLVCYDGKLRRGTEGTVLISRGFAIKVRFKLYAEDNIVENWFVRISDEVYGGYVRQAEISFMRCVLGLPGDWYLVCEI